MTSRFTTLLAAGTLMLAGITPVARAQDGAAQAEIQALRKQIEIQSHKIDALTAIVAQLNAKLDGGNAETAASATTPAAAPAATPTEAEPPVARAVAATTHIVVKGEALEKIAKQHNVAVADLLKLNHISDPKKLQIGQQLVLPPATEKKD